ncbi:Annexin [Hypoxylon sp. EC38]|nr:Annexin [Hypoxylon sp. EC38]
MADGNRYYGQYPPVSGPPPAQPGQPHLGYQQPPQGAPYYPPGGSPAPGQPPHQQPPYYNPPQGQPPVSQYQYPPQQYPGGPPQAPGQYQNQTYPPQQPPQGQYGQPPAPYQAATPYPPQQYGPGASQWPQAQQPMQGYGYGVPPTPASPGYDLAQRAFYAPVETSSDVEALRKAMKGMGCDEAALIRVLTSSKYDNPWAMAQRFIRDLAKDIESETRGNVETALLALIRVLIKALDRAGTDEDALMDVLLCRSNADIRAITAEYKRIKGHDLLVDIKDDVDDTLFRLYSMVLAATRAEDAAPVIAADIDRHVTELQRATEGTIGANAISVAQIFTSSNAAQLHALSEAYQRKYHRSLEEVIEKEFRGDMEDALLYMLENAVNRARADAKRLEKPLYRTPRKDRLFINRVVSLYWDRNRLDAAKAAYQKYSEFRTPLRSAIKALLSGDYEDLMIALIRERK